MPWPTPQDYNEAVQNPRLAFKDAELQAGQPELNQLGLPRPISGGFASVYKIICGQRLWAARCFLTETTDQQDRYEAIDNHLSRVRLPYTVSFKYLPDGIKVKGQMYPLLKMEWVKGETLTSFVARNLSNPAALAALAEKWMQMVKTMQAAGVSHGDLQHGNVLVVDNDLRLIDYDGMFVPKLAGRFSNEVGHRNYQHPSRTNLDYGPHLDNFSAWVIYVALKSLSVHPDLWHKHGGGEECLLFRRDDFLEPSSSALLLDLNHSSNADVRWLAQFLVNLLSLSPLDVPALNMIHAEPATLGALIAPTPQNSPWWKDHIDGKPPVIPPIGKEAEEEPDLSWIIEHDNPAPVEPIRFQSSLAEIRVVALGSCAGLFIAGLIPGVSVFALVGASISVTALIALLCYARYRSDPSVAEYRAFRGAVAEFVKQIREQQVVIANLNAERRALLAKLKATQEEFTRKRRQLDQALQTQLGRAQARLRAGLQQLDQRRRQTVEGEASELRALQENYRGQIAALDRKLNGLAQREADEKDSTLRALKKAYVDARLRTHLLDSSSIPGIGPTYKTRLVRRGITTAADIEYYRIRSVEGIGPKRAAALEHWRDRLVAQAELSAPRILPQLEAVSIEARYQRERQGIQTEKQRLEAEFQSQVASIRQRYAQTRNALVADEQQQRSGSARECAAIKQKCAAELRDLERSLETAKERAQPTLEELAEKLKDAKKHIAMLRWQAAKNQSEESKYRALRFRDFLRSVAGL